jgi:hypothetical protein
LKSVNVLIGASQLSERNYLAHRGISYLHPGKQLSAIRYRLGEVAPRESASPESWIWNWFMVIFIHPVRLTERSASRPVTKIATALIIGGWAEPGYTGCNKIAEEINAPTDLLISL